MKNLIITLLITPCFVYSSSFEHINLSIFENISKYHYGPRPKDIFQEIKEDLKGKKYCFLGDTGFGTKSQKMVAKILLPKCDRIFHFSKMVKKNKTPP